MEAGGGGTRGHDRELDNAGAGLRRGLLHWMEGDMEVESAAVVAADEEVVAAACECCGFTEECTAPYIAGVRARYGGRWICGLCGDAVGEELGRASPPISPATPASAAAGPRPLLPPGAPTTSSRLCGCSCAAGSDPSRRRRGRLAPRPVARGATLPPPPPSAPP
jgi:hypothetical protein